MNIFDNSLIRVGIVGLSASGGWAGRAHVPALRAVDGFELRALSASSAGSAAAAGQAYGIAHTFGAAHELAECPEVDLVVITVKVPEHRRLVMAALDAGKAVLCEWPLGNGLAEAEELAGLARARGIPTAVGLQARSAPAVRFAADLIADGYVGEVLSTTVVGSGGQWGTELHGGRYLLDSANGADMLAIPFGHTLDGVASVLGEFTELTARTAIRSPMVREAATGELVPKDVPDQILVAGTLESGALASFHYRGGLSRGTNLHWEINGTDGDIIITGTTGHLQLCHLTVHGARDGDAEMRPLEIPAAYHRVPGLDPEKDAAAYAVAHAYRQLRDDPTRVPDFDHAVRRHRVLETIRTAA